MHEKYYDESTQSVKGWKELAAPSERFPYGLGLENEDFLATKGIYPYLEVQEEFDALTQELVSDANAIFEDGAYVRHYRPSALPIEVAQKNLQDEFTQKIQQRLDDFAKTRNYDNITSVATYATSSNPKFAEEGQYAVEARDATWAKGYEVVREALSGTRQVPTWEELESELPPLAWPV